MRTFVCLVVFSAMFISNEARGGLYLSMEEFDRSAAYGQDSRFDSVGALWDDTGDGIYRFGGSAVLIAPQWVLASGHQYSRPGGPPGSNFDFRIGNSIDNITLVRPVVETYVHPDWSGTSGSGSRFGEPDLLLLKLQSPITEYAYAKRFRGTDVIGSQLYMAGYGRGGVDSVFLGDSGVKRGGSNILDEFESSINLFVSSSNPFSAVDMEWKGTPGDSGGGWFYEIDGELQLAGITSYASLPFELGGFTGATRVSLFNDWIDQTITAVPEPGSCAFFAAVLGLGLLPRMRKRANEAMDRSRRSMIV